MKKYFDFSFHPLNLLPFAVLAISILWIKLGNVTAIYENSWYENTSILPLIVAIVMCFCAKKHKVLFNVLAMLLILMIAREFSYGRVLFAQIPGTHSYYSWSHYKYGYLAHIFVGIYIAWMAIYALAKKIWVDIKNILTETTIPIWSFIFSFITVGLQYYSERILHYDIGEEVMEYVLYTFIFVIVFIYIKKIRKAEG
ncbi:MAG: hypothetical protein K6A44_02520 [bacterium]|nr:hypothetical protein [bacterium]